MKKFLGRIGLFVLIYFIICTITTRLLPYHWGNPWFSTKIQFLEKDVSIKDSYFFGSSLVYRQIVPTVFDSICSVNGLDVSSFNLGAPAIFCPETYYLYENFLNSELAKDAKYCFIELRKIDHISTDRMHQERTSYWQNYADLKFVVKSFVNDESMTFRSKVEVSADYIKSYLENVFHIGQFKMQLTGNEYYDPVYLGKFKDGFSSLDDRFEYANPIIAENMRQRRSELERNPSILKERMEQVSQSYENVSSSFDKINHSRILELIEKSRGMGIHLIFIMSQGTASKELVELSRHLPQENIIDLSNPEIFPEFYRFENSFDVGHLNLQGAKLYTQILAREFMDRIN